jgi:hypothetical protein
MRRFAMVQLTTVIRCFGALVLVLLTSVAAFAVDTVTIDLGGTPSVLSVNAVNKAMLTRMLTRENNRRAALTPPLAALTLEQFVADLVVDMMRGYKQQTAGNDHQDACTRFGNLTAAQQATIIARAEWGGFSPCPQ